ncbi:MAG: hypothetical protein M3Y59_01425 [Myxococcota bacterium]|nr:hypothetical protein [Myxococcota bacterium]
MEPARLWPDRPVETLQTFFIRIGEGADRSAAFASAVRALKSARWHDFGKFVLRLPPTTPWLVVDWHGPLDLPGEALEAISQRLDAELLSVGAITGHGRSAGQLFVRRFASGRPAAGGSSAAARWPSSLPVGELPEFAAALGLPEDTLPPQTPTVEVTCVPDKLAVWGAILVLGGLAAVLFT